MHCWKGLRLRIGGAVAVWALVCVVLLVFALPAPGSPQSQPQGGLGEIQPLDPTPTPAPLPPLEEPGVQPATTAASPAPEKAAGLGLGSIKSELILLAVVVLVVVSTIIVVLAVVLKPTTPIIISHRPVSAVGGSTDAPIPTSWDESSRVRMGRPPEGTLKILPGHFVIEDEDGPVEIRIFRTTGDSRVETTIGRDEGPPYRHIQFKPLSVSGKHAKLVYENGVYSIVNYSRVNPVKVNDEALEEGASQRLIHEDRIEIGEVPMTYYEN